MTNARRSHRIIAQVAFAAVGATGLMAATRAEVPVKGITYRVRVQTQMPNFGGGGGDVGGGGGEFPGGFGGGNSQLVRVELAGDRAKVEFQLGNPPGSSITDYYLMLLDSNKVYRVSPDAQTFTDGALAVGAGRGGGQRGGFGGGGDGGRQAAGGRGGRGGNNNPGGDQGRAGRGGGGINPMTVLTDAVITAMRTKVEDLGAGEVIETRATRHYKITVDYDFKLYGQPRDARTVTEIWAVDYAQRVVDPFQAGNALGDTMTMADVSRRILAEAKKISGVHVKTVTTQTVPASAVGAAEVEVTPVGSVPQTVNIVRTTTITALKDSDIDEAGLKIPADYKKVAGFGRGGQ